MSAFVCAFPRPLAIATSSLLGEFGREQLRDLGLVDSEISAKHASLVARNDVVSISDSGSRNGTFIDGRRLAPQESVALVDGSLVRMGRTVFVYREALLGGLAPSPPMGSLVAPYGLREVAHQLGELVRRPNPFVLIEGETGTGKELLARCVAHAVGRSDVYTAVNVVSIPDGVFDSQLFGHVAGAFSDARTASPGVFGAHDGGAVFLDEIGSLPLALQGKLLRLLDQREILPVGATRARTIDVIVIAATNGGLESAVSDGRFRADLLARLAVARFELPPLRDRAEDVFAIATTLAARHQLDLDPRFVEVEAVERLLSYPWPRNARELEAALRQASMLDPRPGLRLWTIKRIVGDDPDGRSFALTDAIVAEALAATSGNETAAARRLGVTRGKLRRHLSRKDPS